MTLAIARVRAGVEQRKTRRFSQLAPLNGELFTPLASTPSPSPIVTCQCLWFLAWYRNTSRPRVNYAEV
jgi:hypothetical protein